MVKEHELWKDSFKYTKTYDAGAGMEVGKIETPYYCPHCKTVGFNVFAHSVDPNLIGCVKCGKLMGTTQDKGQWHFVPVNKTFEDPQDGSAFDNMMLDTLRNAEQWVRQDVENNKVKPVNGGN